MNILTLHKQINDHVSFLLKDHVKKINVTIKNKSSLGNIELSGIGNETLFLCSRTIELAEPIGSFLDLSTSDLKFVSRMLRTRYPVFGECNNYRQVAVIKQVYKDNVVCEDNHSESSQC